jgi:hypothetical protein
MSGVYTVTFTGVAVTAQQDFFEIVAHSSKQCVLLAFGVSQSTEVGDTAEEGLSVLVKSGSTVSGSGGSSATPANNDGSGGASGFTAEVNNTTKANTGTIVTHYPYNWNIRMPLDILLPEPMQIVFGASRRLTIELATTPADSITVSGYAVIQEIG